MGVHYPIGPSSLSRLIACPGSYQMIRDNPQLESRDSKYSREGTAAHEYAAACLQGDWPEVPRLCNRCNASLASPPCVECGCSECRIASDIPEMVQPYLEFVNELRSLDIRNEGVEFPIQSNAMPDFGGTVDYFAIYREGDETLLHVVDLKTGAGVPVDAEGNMQLAAYAALIAEQYGVSTFSAYRATIVQPRVGAGTPQTWEFDATIIEAVWRRIAYVLKDTPRDLQSGDHCRWCPVKSLPCPALFDIAQEAAQGEFADEDRLLWLLEVKSRLEDLLATVGPRVLELMQAGREFVGWKAVRAISNRRWVSDEETVLKKLRGRGIGKKQLTELKLKSPATLDKEGHAEKIADLVIRTETGYRVVPVTAKGEAVTFANAQDEFEAI